MTAEWPFCRHFFPLKIIKGTSADDEEVNQYIENGARFDFVFAENDKIYAIIEIDGAYHRSDPETMYKDELKNRAIKSLSEEFYNERFIRIPTDGTTSMEIDKIRNSFLMVIFATLVMIGTKEKGAKKWLLV